MKKIILSIFLSFSIVYAIDFHSYMNEKTKKKAEDQLQSIKSNLSTTPKEDTSVYFPAENNIKTNKVEADDKGTNKPLVADDTLPEAKIQGAYFYYENMKPSNYQVTLDKKTGKMIIKDSYTNKQIDAFYELHKSDEYNNSLNYIKAKINQIENLSYEIKLDKKHHVKKEIIDQKIKKLNKLRDELDSLSKVGRIYGRREALNHNFKLTDFLKIDTTFPESKSAAGAAIVNKYFLTKKFRVKDINDTNSTSYKQLMLIEDNTTKFYRSHFGINIDLAGIDQMTDTNVGKLKKAYQFVKEAEQVAKSKLNSGVIKCYISRTLLPSFYCPYPDMTGTVYPDYTASGGDPYKVSAVEAEETCNKACQKPRKCYSYNVEKYMKGTITMPYTNVIYPINITGERTPPHISFKPNPLREVSYLEFDINVTKTKDFNGTDKDFDKYLATLNPRVRFRNYMERTDKTGYKTKILSNNVTFIHSANQHQKYLINQAGGTYDFYFYGAFAIDYKNSYEKELNRQAMKYIKQIKITNIKIGYRNKNLYFCPFKQLVTTDNECPNGKVVDLVESGKVLRVCTNTDHMIGPDRFLGGFYDEQSCEASCHEYKKCKVTYKHYATEDANSLYKVDIGCVDDDQNSGCSKSLCEHFFSKGDIRPINEVVIQNDNKRVYTIRNSVFTKVPRPKINYDGEKNIMTDSNHLTFQTEMKDEAYNYMIKNKSYTKVKYLVGEPSPMRLAYHQSIVSGKRQLDALLKPLSSDFDTGVNENIYMFMKYEQTYRPAYGIFQVGGHNVDATKQDIEFKDISYLIKKPDGNWKVFKVINFAKVKNVKWYKYCDGNNGPAYEIQKGEYVDPNCKIEKRVVWQDVPAYTQARNVFYDKNRDIFVNYSLSETAPAIKTMKFESYTPYFKFPVTSDLFGVLENTPGATIHSQIEKREGASFARVYNGPYVGPQRGYPANVTLYLRYSPSKLTYGEIINSIENSDKYAFWELFNQYKYNSEIKDDGKFKDSNIRVFKLGDMSKTTIDVKVKPTFSERGERVFKFLFLYDKDKDPFKE